MAAEVGSERLPELYETLRRSILDPSAEPWTGSRPCGFGVLVRRGMAAWIGIGSSWTSARTPRTPAPSPVALPDSIQAQLAAVLASTLLSHRPGARR